MTTERKTLTTDWVQVADGSATVTVQVLQGVALVATGSAAPTNTKDAHAVEGWLRILPPLSAWARTGNNNAEPVDVIITQ